MPAGEGNPETILFRYTVRPARGAESKHDVLLDADTLERVEPPPEERPPWTALDFHRCPHCPMDAAAESHCPAALRLAPLLERFRNATSYEEVQVLVSSPERMYGKRTSLQEVAGALVGLTLVTSGCPILDGMRPLARTHLPFPSGDEYAYRLLGMALYAQYLRHRVGRPADWDLAELAAHLDEVEEVNRHLCKRLNAVREHDNDVGINAVNVMNSSLHLARLALEETEMTPWAPLFERYRGGGRKKEGKR